MIDLIAAAFDFTEGKGKEHTPSSECFELSETSPPHDNVRLS